MTKRTTFFALLLLMLTLITLISFEKSIIVWAGIIGFIVYIIDTEYAHNSLTPKQVQLQKGVLFLISTTAFFSLIDVDWKRAEWLKSYVDFGTVLVIFFLITGRLLNLSKRSYILTALFALAVIPVFVIMQLLILAEVYAVFAFVLLFILILCEVRKVRTVN